MGVINPAILLTLALSCYHIAYGTRIRKNYTDTQLDLFKDIAKNIKQESKQMPTSSQVIEEMNRLDDAEYKKIDARIAKETAELTAEHGSCGTVNYERDYSQLCPSGWKPSNDGSCWGENYKGPCEALQTFKWFNDEEKRNFEQRCCAFWPPIDHNVISTSGSMLLSALNGSVNHDDGTIVAPRQ
ncbi:cpw-wpc domain-containing, putative [Babesia ovis]|uniref:Cpw-wpc domain-containing, putative n=1 Tax=Babesia ovis TaxID=5869 RepID=A0A9W5WT94_BABOV|nr:cpw-wpc domain-containing, putative [Babesia ovis]